MDYDGRIYRQVSQGWRVPCFGKRCMMASGSYDNNDELGLTGQHDDGLWLRLRRAARPRESARLDTDWSLGVWSQTPKALQAIWCLSNSQLNNMKASCERIVSASDKKKNTHTSRTKCLLNLLEGREEGGLSGGLRQICTVIQMVRTLRPQHKQDPLPKHVQPLLISTVYWWMCHVTGESLTICMTRQLGPN